MSNCEVTKLWLIHGDEGELKLALRLRHYPARKAVYWTTAVYRLKLSAELQAQLELLI